MWFAQIGSFSHNYYICLSWAPLTIVSVSNSDSDRDSSIDSNVDSDIALQVAQIEASHTTPLSLSLFLTLSLLPYPAQ